jgi:lysophospholipase L1-like esterase
MNTFLALGDSYTIGEGAPPSGRWPAQLAARLRGEGIEVVDPQIVAATGWATDELSAALDAAAIGPPFALVTLLIGVNNQYRGRGLDEYRDQYRTLLQRSIGLAGGNAACVIAVSIPDWGVTPFARGEGRDAATIASAIDAFNAVACAEAVGAGVRWIDVTGISRAADAREELASDGLHPSAAQYARWVEAILPGARAILATG